MFPALASVPMLKNVSPILEPSPGEIGRFPIYPEPGSTYHIEVVDALLRVPRPHAIAQIRPHRLVEAPNLLEHVYGLVDLVLCALDGLLNARLVLLASARGIAHGVEVQ